MQSQLHVWTISDTAMLSPKWDICIRYTNTNMGWKWGMHTQETSWKKEWK